MRHVLLRTAAFGIVVVLGLIAIAQAQRGSDDTPPAADDLTGGGHRCSRPTAPPTASKGPTRAAPAKTPCEATDESPSPSRRDRRATMLLADYRESPATVNPVAAELPSRMPSADPFGFRADRHNAALIPAPAVLAGTKRRYPVRRIAGSPAGPIRPAARPRDTSQYGAMAAAGSSTGQMAPLAAPAAQAIDDAAATDGYSYPNYSAGTSTAREPARFGADPYAAPAGLSTSTGPTTSPRRLRLADGHRVGHFEPAGGRRDGPAGQQAARGPPDAPGDHRKNRPAGIQVGKPAEVPGQGRSTPARSPPPTSKSTTRSPRGRN